MKLVNDLILKEDITEWCLSAMSILDIPKSEANSIISALVKTSLWGIDSHGIARIPHYLTRFENGTLNKNPIIRFHKSGDATGMIDGDDGHGISIMRSATEHAISLASNAGCAVVGAYNSSHCGAIGLYTRQVTESGMIGLAFTHADALVVPYGGNKPFFGTNPISIAFPTEITDEPICLDMATSIVPWNYVMNAKRENTKIPFGLGVDIEGNDSENPNEIIAVKPMAGYKGFGLAFMVDMFCSVLNGMNYGPNMTSMYKDLDKKRKLGSTIIAIDPKRFGGQENFIQVASNMIQQIKSTNSNIMFPGEPEYKSFKQRNKFGIPFSKPMKDEFNFWSDKLNIERL